jgi:hypothetical protein
MRVLAIALGNFTLLVLGERAHIEYGLATEDQAYPGSVNRRSDTLIHALIIRVHGAPVRATGDRSKVPGSFHSINIRTLFQRGRIL